MYKDIIKRQVKVFDLPVEDKLNVCDTWCELLQEEDCVQGIELCPFHDEYLGCDTPIDEDSLDFLHKTLQRLIDDGYIDEYGVALNLSEELYHNYIKEFEED